MTELFIHPLWDWRSAIASPYGPENPITRQVLLTIALHMSPAGDSAFPTIERLVAETGLAKSTVSAHTAIAQKTGWLGKRERSSKSGQGWRRVEYLPLVPAGVDEKARAWREASRAAWQKRVPPPGQPQGDPPDDEGVPPDSKKVYRQAVSKVSSNTPSKPAAARREQPPHPVDNSRPAAAAGIGKLLYPPNLSAAQQHAMDAYLKGLSPRAAQLLLDELAGLLERGINGKAVRDPMAVFASLARQNDDGKFVPSHAHRVQAEREAIAPEAQHG